MRGIRRFIVVIVAVVAVNVAPVAAMAGPISNACQGVEEELSRYGWHTSVCTFDDPLETP